MKRVLLYAISLMMTGSLAGQSQGQSLVTGSTDFVGFSNWATMPHMVEAGPNSFFWISGANVSISVDHPMLTEVYSDFPNVFFIKYDENGVAQSANHIKGTYITRGAFSFNGGLTLMALASNNVNASGNILPLNGADNIEFIAKYDSDSKLEKIVNIWNLDPSQYPYSQAVMDKKDGSMYLFGYGYNPMDLDGYGLIGKEWTDKYIYVIKYNPDLQFEWVYTAGFEQSEGFGYFTNLKVFPDCNGNAVFTGGYESQMSPIFDGFSLPFYLDGMGMFAVKLNGNGEQEWFRDGPMQGYGNGTFFFKGLAMNNGDLVMAGVTTTGYFKLGEAEFIFKNGSGYANHFVYRMRPDGSVNWQTSFNSMGRSYSQEKKGAESELFADEFLEDAIHWKEKLLYMTGTFLSDSFEVAEMPLPKKYAEGIFIASVDMNSGAQIWGTAFSSDRVCLNGFDRDASGNLSLMGCTSEQQDIDGIGEVSVLGTDLVFHLGLDYHGNPLWYNNAHLQGLGSGIYGVDLEVLRDGEVFSSIYLSQTDYLEIGGSSMIVDYPYTNRLVALNAASELGGLVSDQSGNPVFPGFVRAYKSSRAGAFPMVDSVMLDDAGRYLFQGLYPGNYTLQVVPDPETYPEAIPTYLGNEVDWNDAQFNDFKVDTKVDFLDIVVTEVSKLTPEDGSGVMSGFVSYEEEGALKGTLAKPVKKASVLVVKRPAQKTTNAEEVVAYVETDDFGNFTFEHVPDGDYLLLIDIAGLNMIETHEVNIVGNRIISGLDYTVGPDGIYTWTGVGIPTEETDYLKMFPNPGNGLIFMDFPTSGDYLIRIYGTDGRLVASRDYSSLSGLMTLDISEQNRGIYMIKIEGPDLSTTLKYIKR